MIRAIASAGDRRLCASRAFVGCGAAVGYHRAGFDVVGVGAAMSRMRPSWGPTQDIPNPTGEALPSGRWTRKRPHLIQVWSKGQVGIRANADSLSNEGKRIDDG